MYRNINKTKLYAALSTENTLDSCRIKKGNLNNSKQNTSKSYSNSIELIKEKINSFPLIKEKEKSSPKFQFKLKFTKNNNNDFIRKKILKGKLIKLINNSQLEPNTDEEVV